MSHRQNNSLFVVATPIGNLKDITLRALDVLKDVDLIVSENVRKTRNLLDHYCIKTKVTSYRESNCRRLIPSLVKMMKSGKDVALVAEAGTPGISDPGRRLVRAVLNEGLRVVPVPGASAAIAAVSVSGMEEPRFVFEGFLPRRRSKRRRRLRELADVGLTLVFFEAPHRLLCCLRDMVETLGDRQCVIGREVTKLYEGIERGVITSFIDKYENTRPRGEFVIVCEGASDGAWAISSDRILEEAAILIGEGMKKTDIAKALAKRHGLSGRDVYRTIARAPGGRGKGDNSEG